MYLPACVADADAVFGGGESLCRKVCTGRCVRFEVFGADAAAVQHMAWAQGHSVPNGDPMVPFEGAQGFSGMMLYFPDEGNGPKKLLPVPTEDGQIMLYVAVPVYAEEMNYKLAAGADALEDRLRAHCRTPRRLL